MESGKSKTLNKTFELELQIESVFVNLKINVFCETTWHNKTRLNQQSISLFVGFADAGAYE